MHSRSHFPSLFIITIASALTYEHPLFSCLFGDPFGLKIHTSLENTLGLAKVQAAFDTQLFLNRSLFSRNPSRDLSTPSSLPLNTPCHISGPLLLLFRYTPSYKPNIPSPLLVASNSQTSCSLRQVIRSSPPSRSSTRYKIATAFPFSLLLSSDKTRHPLVILKPSTLFKASRYLFFGEGKLRLSEINQQRSAFRFFESHSRER